MGKPLQKVELHRRHRERNAALEAGLIENATPTLDRETISWVKAQTGQGGEAGGTAWIMLAGKTLQEHVRHHTNPELEKGSATGQDGTTRR